MKVCTRICSGKPSNGGAGRLQTIYAIFLLRFIDQTSVYFLESPGLHLRPMATVPDRSLCEVEEKERSQAAGKSGVSVEEDGPLVRVKNLVWIKANTYYKAALDDWEQQRKSLGGKLERREKRAEELTNQVYNVVGFFSVFQGVILSAVAQLNSQQAAEETTPARPLCNKVWYPFALSLLAVVAAGVGIGSKFIDLRRTEKNIRNFKRRLRNAERKESLLRMRGAEFVFSSLQDETIQVSPKLYWRLFEELSVIAGLIVFTTLFCMSYFAILCDKLVPQWL